MKRSVAFSGTALPVLAGLVLLAGVVLLLRQCTSDTRNARGLDAMVTAELSEAPELGLDDPASADAAVFSREGASAESSKRESREVSYGDDAVFGRCVDSRGLAVVGAGLRAQLSYQTIDGRKHEVLSTETRSGGRFVFSELPPSRFHLAIDADSAPVGFQTAKVAKMRGRALDLGDIVLPRTAALRGRVVDSRGAPLPNVDIYHSVISPVTECQELDYGRIAPADPMQAAHATSDALGIFEFRRIAAGDVTILVEPLRAADMKKYFEVEAGQLLDAGDFVVRAGRDLRGFVSDEFGKPIEGARVCENSGLRAKVRKGVRSGRDGTFRIHGLSKSVMELTIAADGFVPAVVRSRTGFANEVIRQRLRRTIELRGRVVGLKRAATYVQVDWQLADNDGFPDSSVYAQTHERHLVNADGEFSIPGLVPGVYTLTAIAKATREGAAGRSKATKYRLTSSSAPIDLVLAPDPAVMIRVVDEQGAPILGAEVLSDPGIARYETHWRKVEGRALLEKIRRNPESKRRFTTDERGLVRHTLEAGKSLAIAIEANGYVAVARKIAGPAPGSEIRVRLQRAAAIRGEVRHATWAKHYKLSLRLWRAPSAQSRAASALHEYFMRVDAQSSFRHDALPPGTWNVGLVREDQTRWKKRDHSPLVSKAIPYLAPAEPKRAALQTVLLRAGEEKVLSLSTSPVGRLHGRVLCAGKPVEGAIVWASRPGEDRHRDDVRYGRLWDEADSHSMSPRCTTGVDGRYEFLFAHAAEYELRVRVGQSAANGPYGVRLNATRQNQKMDLRVSAGGIRARFKLGAPSRDFPIKYFARLFRIDAKRAALVSDDPYVCGQYSASLAMRVPRARLSKSGAFEFSNLPAASWLLRIGTEFGNESLYQTLVRSRENGVVDLGLLASPSSSELSLKFRLPQASAENGWGVWIRALDRAPVPIHVASMRLKSELRLALSNGRYECELFRRWPFHPDLLSNPPYGKAAGAKIEFTVRGEGDARQVLPAQLDFSALDIK